MTDQDFEWLTREGDKPEPRMEFITTLWRMRGRSGRNIECSAYHVDTAERVQCRCASTEVN